ncbi:excalibur calcium-binding domain-containing protein [Streptomyces sp. NPDC058664]|uniref:excalibur calcium-binding domain-containing protein n=1 Tax=unclassified Streptomyces TaxID=2593676 RepID=UPI003660905F
MYPPPHSHSYGPATPPRRRWWQHPALVVTLLVLFPPAGIALAWLSRWSSRAKIVATVLSALWFLAVLLGDAPKENGTADPEPAATVTASATPTTAAPSPTPTTPAPTTVEPTPEPTPTTVEPTPEPTGAPPRTSAPEPARTPVPEPTTRKPEPVRTTEAAPVDVYYENCSAVRAAGAAPIHVGDPGYSRKLDRDGDGVACEN